MLTTTTQVIDKTAQGIAGSFPAGAAVLIVNVGGLDKAGKTVGPDDAQITVREQDGTGRSFLLLSGAGVTIKGTDIAGIYVRAVTTSTTLSYMVAADDCQ